MVGPHKVWRRTGFFLLLAVLAAGLSGCFGAVVNPGPPTFSISSMPAGASILLNGTDTGHKTPHKFTGLTSGVYDVTLAMPGLPDHNGKAVVSANRSTAYHYTLTGGMAHITGYVTESMGGLGVPGTIVTAGQSEALTDSAGKFDLFVPPGVHDITAYQPGWATGRRLGVQAEADATTDAHIVQRHLFSDSAGAAPMELIIDGIKAGDAVTDPVRVTVRAVSSHAVAHVNARLGHADAVTADFEANGAVLEFDLNPQKLVPGAAMLHVAAYDVQYNGVQQAVPFTVAPRHGPGPSLAAPSLSVTAYTASESTAYLSLGGIGQSLNTAGGGVGNHFVNVEWDRIPDAAGYRLMRREEHSPTWQHVADVSDLRTSYVDASPVLQAGPAYYYAAAALGENGEAGAKSDHVRVVLLEPFSAYLARPLHRAFNVGSSVELQWLAAALPPRPEGAYEYEYEVRVQKTTGSRPEIEQRVTNDTSLRISGLDACTQYTWDLHRATATLTLSKRAKAISISGSHKQPAGGSLNGGYMFSTACSLSQLPGGDL